jgi:hypothetical protein
MESNMRPLTYLEIGAAVALVIAGALGLHFWEQKEKAIAVAEATQKAQDTLQKQFAQQVTDLQKQIADRDAQYQADRKAEDARFAQAQNPTQIAALVAQVMGLKQPITITTPPPTAANPNPAPIAQVSTLDAPQVKAYLQDCESCKLERTKMQADAADREAQAKLAQQTIDSLKKENLLLTTELKGGSVWKRVGKTLLVSLCAGGGGYAASPRGAVAAGIGAGFGAIACTIAVRK